MYKCRLLFCLMLCLALMLSLSACAEGLSIVCTNFPCYDFARAVNGSDANIRMLIKPGAEVHSFEPAPSDILAIAECDLFIYIGGESDAWVVDILESFDGEGPAVLRLFDCVEALELIHEDNHHHEGEYDEHIWTSPVNASRMVGEIAACMSDLDGSNAERYAANAGAYIDAAFAAGANSLDYVDFSAKDTQEAANQALALAVESARERAKVLAEAAGLDLGGILEIRDGSDSGYDYGAAYARNASEEDVGGGTEVLASKQSVSASVIITFALGE